MICALQTAEWGEFMHIKGQKYTDFDMIRREIEAETDRGAGSGKSVSSKPINLRIYSPRVLNLTLVDLPGLTKVAIGDQPKDIETQIRTMVKLFISNPNSIILAVSPANVDLANSDALNLARELDPDGVRTVGVLTKLDLMDKGTNAMDVLQGRVYPLRLGFIGVVNRSQHDINTNKPIDDALKQERQFFETHPLYSSIKSRCGYPFLAQTLNRILLTTIRDTLPDLKANLTMRLRSAQDALGELGDSQMNQSKSALMLNILTRYASTFSATIDGQLTDLPLNALYGGSRINFIFVDVFGKCLESMSSVEGLTPEDLRMAITNASGPRSALFLPEAAFDQIVRQQILRLETPSLECADCVFEELKSIANKIEIPELRRFGQLRERISEVVHTLLSQAHHPARKMISSMVSIERDFINTAHPEFIGGDGAIARAINSRAKQDADANPLPASTSSSSSASASQTTPSKYATPAGASAQRGAANDKTVPGDIPREYHDRYEKSRDEALGERSRREEVTRREEEPAATAAQNSNFFGAMARFFKSRPTTPTTTSVNEKPRITQAPANITSSNLGAAAASDFQTQVLAILLSSYFGIVKKGIRDRVPKAIMHFLVAKVKHDLQTELVRQLYKEDILDELLRESGDVAARRQKYAQSIDLFKKVLVLLADVETNRVF